MTLVERQQRERDRAIRAALKEHGSIRRAAAELGMARSTLHERAVQLGVRMDLPKRRRHKTRKARARRGR